jgi:hypothetical protein
MARITRPGFTGQVGPVRFAAGVAETDDPDVLAFCTEHPDYTVHPPEGEDTEHDHDDPEVADQLDQLDARED